MTPRHFCTYFDHNYLPRAMVMMESLHAYCPEAHIHVLCLSRECREALSHIAYPFVSLLDLEELETADPELAATRGTRTLIEYYFTITPCLPWYLLTGKGIAEVTYLDADMMFFSSPAPLFEEAEGASVIITPHRFPSDLSGLEQYGLYNVSWMTFRNTDAGMACLSWYREACLDWCFDRPENTRYADQKYLDFFPRKFKEIHVMGHPGGGVAPWNVAASSFSLHDGRFSVDGVPLIFYHAQGFKHIMGSFYASGLLAYGANLRRRMLRNILLEYARAYSSAVRKAATIAGNQDFFGIREPMPLNPLLSGKRILKEFLYRTLVWCHEPLFHHNHSNI